MCNVVHAKNRRRMVAGMPNSVIYENAIQTHAKMYADTVRERMNNVMSRATRGHDGSFERHTTADE